MDPLYEGIIDRKRLYIPQRLDDAIFALRLEENVVATFYNKPVPLLALRHPDVYDFEVKSKSLNDNNEKDVFEGIRFLCAGTEKVQRDKNNSRRLIFHKSSLSDLCIGDKTSVCLDITGENLIIVKKEDWQKYSEWRSVNSK